MTEKSAVSVVAGLVLWIAVSLSAGAIGSRFMPGAWYAALAKPSWTPPGWVFGPVWAALYIMMGIAAWLVWKETGFSGAKGPLALFLIQLALNALWSYLFFGARSPMLAFYEIIVLWVAILLTLEGFWRIRPFAGALLIPYLAWAGFAAALNFRLWRLNL